MSESVKTDVKQELKKARTLTRVLHFISPAPVEAVIEARLRREKEEQAKEQAERVRRQELGPKGRILEDAARAIYAGARDFADLRKDQRDGIFYPFEGYKDSEGSNLTKIATFLQEANIQDKNVLDKLKGEWYGFDAPLTADNQLALDENQKPKIYLVSKTKKNNDYVVMDSIQLTNGYLDSLSVLDLKVLELAAANSRQVSVESAYRYSTSKSY